MIRGTDDVVYTHQCQLLAKVVFRLLKPLSRLFLCPKVRIEGFLRDGTLLGEHKGKQYSCLEERQCSKPDGSGTHEVDAASIAIDGNNRAFRNSGAHTDHDALFYCFPHPGEEGVVAIAGTGPGNDDAAGAGCHRCLGESGICARMGCDNVDSGCVELLCWEPQGNGPTWNEIQ